jgi:hypothetical protein
LVVETPVLEFLGSPAEEGRGEKGEGREERGEGRGERGERSGGA